MKHHPDILTPLTEVEKAALLNGLQSSSQARKAVRRALCEIDALKAERDALRAENARLAETIEVFNTMPLMVRLEAAPVSPEADAMAEQERRWDEAADADN